MKKKYDIQQFNPQSILMPVFSKAQKTDEFEFCCSLMRIRGCEDAGWDPLSESNELINQLLSLIQAPLDDKMKVRLLLFLYCHVTEIDDLYNVIANLLRVCMGERCSMSPFIGQIHPSGKPANSPHSKVSRIAEWSNEVGFPEIGKMLTYMLVKQVRNAFFHSDYIIHENQFNIKYGEGVLVDNIITKAVPFDWLLPRLELGVNIALSTIDLIHNHMRSYKEEKIVPARILADGGIEDVVLTVHPEFGLTGFHSLTKEEREKFEQKVNHAKEE